MSEDFVQEIVASFPRKTKANCTYALLGFISSVAQFLVELKLAQLLV